MINPFLSKKDTKVNKIWFQVVEDMVPRGYGSQY